MANEISNQMKIEMTYFNIFKLMQVHAYVGVRTGKTLVSYMLKHGKPDNVIHITELPRLTGGKVRKAFPTFLFRNTLGWK